jgi:hypothetical protein
MRVNPWLVVFAFVLGVLVERLRARIARDRSSSEGIRKLEAGEYGERLREKWEKLKKEQE